MAWVAGGLFGVATLGTLVVLLSKPKQYDPQMGQAQGCLMIMLMGLLLMDGALAVGVGLDSRAVISIVFGAAVLPIAWVALGLVYNLILLIRRRLFNDG
jgi:hypothetical protein